MFQKLSRRYDGNDMRDFLLANLLKGRTWIGELLEDEADENFRQYQKKKQSLSYTFSNDLDKLFNNTPPMQTFKVGKGVTYPKVFDELMQENLSLETFSILDKYLGLCKIYDERLGKDDVLWSKYRLLIIKLHPFLEYDRVKLKNILMEKIHEHAVL